MYTYKYLFANTTHMRHIYIYIISMRKKKRKKANEKKQHKLAYECFSLHWRQRKISCG